MNCFIRIYYGAGNVNINTAPLPVLVALTHETLAQKIIHWRSGGDVTEGTEDDRVCTNVADLINPLKSLNQTEHLTTEEISLLETLNYTDSIDVVSKCYQIKAEGVYRGKNAKRITCIAKAHDQKVWIVFWRQ
ncbi:hypothetical protein ACFL5I_02110 [Planctomycetota bacterium]